uniref:Uncharacterized protein n=1 Tax=Medicago truncatula TaxID=3880 RepID=Q2HV49_MEDTR|nr:hypothetical protein MtrDRAFT_AC148995g16v2 [Medicago truncatula]
MVWFITVECYKLNEGVNCVVGPKPTGPNVLVLDQEQGLLSSSEDICVQHMDLRTHLLDYRAHLFGQSRIIGPQVISLVL